MRLEEVVIKSAKQVGNFTLKTMVNYPIEIGSTTLFMIGGSLVGDEINHPYYGALVGLGFGAITNLFANAMSEEDDYFPGDY